MPQVSSAPKIKLLAVAGLATLGLAACGSEPEEGPDDVTRQFLTALAEGDGEAACSYTSSAAIEQVEAEEGGSCEEAVVAASGEVTDEGRAQLEEATYEVSDETDDSASVTAIRPDGEEETFELVKEDDEWKVNG